MPWTECSPMSELLKFIAEYEAGGDSFTELCRRFGISRKTGYKWVERWEAEGPDGLKPRSQAPRNCPWALNQALEEAIVKVRGKHPTWGARKILAWLERKRPGLELCAASTASLVLSRRGLVVSRRRRPRATPSSILRACEEANQTWCADFKGWFLLGNGLRCDPLTITDAHTRFVLRCQALSGSTGYDAVRPIFEAAFAEYGLPMRIRTDNGPPFATTGLGGLSELSVWFLELGIEPERIRPASPQENGRHERMHRTLKAEATVPPEHTLRAQQRRFDTWRQAFNEERPHEALRMETPGSLYTRSERELPRRPTIWTYGDDFEEERKVKPSGQIKWQGKTLHVTHALRGRTVGLNNLGRGYWEVWYRHLLLGLLDEKQCRIIRPGRRVLEIMSSLKRQE